MRRMEAMLLDGRGEQKEITPHGVRYESDYAGYGDGMAYQADVGSDLWHPSGRSGQVTPADCSSSEQERLGIWNDDLKPTQITTLAAAQDEGYDVDDGCIGWLQVHFVAMSAGTKGNGKNKSSSFPTKGT